LVGNPIGGTPLSSAYLESLVNAEVQAMSALSPGAQGAAEGWSNSRTRAEFFDVLVTTSGTIAAPVPNAKAFVTSACGSAGGSATTLQKIRGLDGGEGYQVSCRSLVHKTSTTLEIVCLVKANVLEGFFAVIAPRFPIHSVDALAIRQSRLIPLHGI
jgi:hypothetical protein